MGYPFFKFNNFVVKSSTILMGGDFSINMGPTISAVDMNIDASSNINADGLVIDSNE